jgi:cyclophilin family peptidyl-prolyl cis-trans isomerase
VLAHWDRAGFWPLIGAFEQKEHQRMGTRRGFLGGLLAAGAMMWASPVLAGAADKPVVVIETSLGTVKAELYPDKAPITVKNFLSYVEAKHYDGTIFHRVINDFMIQGGGYDEQLREKSTKAPIRNEAANGLKNTVGTLAMARTSIPDSATAQFFINVKDNFFLDYKNPTPSGHRLLCLWKGDGRHGRGQ